MATTRDGSRGWCWRCGEFQEATRQVCVKCGAARPVRKSAPWTWQGVVFLALLVAIPAVIGYGLYRAARPPQEATTPEPILEVMAILGEPPDVVEAHLGSAVEIVLIENVPDFMPGEFRDYLVAGVSTSVTVRFLRGRAKFITVYLDEGVETAEEALLMVGLDLRTRPATFQSPLVIWWRQFQQGGKTFEKAGAWRGMNGSPSGFDMIQVEAR